MQAPQGVDYYRKPFEFLSLGIMAYVGNDKALTQVGRNWGREVVPYLCHTTVKKSAP